MGNRHQDARADIDEDEVPRVRPGARVERLALGVAQRARS